MQVSERGRRRFPRSVFDHGSEPDVRFTLANERTFLAWTRTSLALIAGGVALEVLGLDLQPYLRLAASTLLVITGTILPVVSWCEWASNERALREGEPLPSSPWGAVLAGIASVVGIVVILAVFLR